MSFQVLFRKFAAGFKKTIFLRFGGPPSEPKMTVHPRGRSSKVADDLVVLNSGKIIQVTSKEEDGTFSGPQLLLGPLPLARGRSLAAVG